jgi:hypothetical protein
MRTLTYKGSENSSLLRGVSGRRWNKLTHNHEDSLAKIRYKGSIKSKTKLFQTFNNLEKLAA